MSSYSPRVSSRMEEIVPHPIRAMFEAASEMKRRGIEVIHLEIGEPDFTTPKNIIEAAKRALDEGYTHYVSHLGLLELREAIAEKLERENKIHVDPKTELLVTAGANAATFVASQTFLDIGDEVIIPTPSYEFSTRGMRMVGGKISWIPVKEEDDFRLDPEELEKKITSRTKLIWIVNPDNPKGTILTKEDLEAIADIAQKHDLLVVCDEIYENFTYDGYKHVSLASIPGMEDRTITINGFSKRYAMTGWRLGYMTADKKLMNKMILCHHAINTCCCAFGQRGALEALTGPQDSVKEMVTEYAERRKLVLNMLNKMDGVSFVRPKGAFYVFPNISAFKRTSMDLAKYLLENARVAVTPGMGFGPTGDGYIRISYSNSRENIKRGFERINEALKKLIPSS